MAAHYDILIVGAGQAGRRAAEAARRTDARAGIAILGDEPHLPYDRPPLSKDALKDPARYADCEKRSAAQYAEDRIDLLLGERAERLDRAARTVRTAGGRALHYDRLVIATGSRVRRLALPAGLEDDVLYLRTRDDADRLRARIRPGARLALIGAGFVGLEVAASARELGAQVVVLDQAARVLSRVLPAQAGARVQARHERAGVDFLLGARIAGISRAPSGRLAIDVGGSVLEADTAVAGIGVLPNTELAQEAGLAVDDGLLVDEYGRTDDPAVFGAGEVTRHPVAGLAGRARLESWQVAEFQAEAAGAGAAGALTPYRALPWFWSDQYDLNIQMAGHAPAGARIVARGADDGPQTLFFLDGGDRLAGAVAFNNGRDISGVRRVVEKGAPVDPAVLAAPGPLSWRDLLR